jgi:hypothetical protein
MLVLFNSLKIKNYSIFLYYISFLFLHFKIEILLFHIIFIYHYIMAFHFLQNIIYYIYKIYYSYFNIYNKNKFIIPKYVQESKIIYTFGNLKRPLALPKVWV